MPLASGSMSICRYKALGLNAPFSLAKLNEGFIPLQAKKLKLQGSSKDIAWGWDRPSALISEEDGGGSWDLSHCQLGDNFLLNIRIEKRKVPSRLLQMISKDKLHKKQQRREKPISAKERKQIWQETKDELIALALPEVQYVECLWNIADSEILLFSTSKRVAAIFEELFVKSFIMNQQGLQLIKLEPPLFGLAEAEWASEKNAAPMLKKLTQAVPTGWHG